MSLPQSDTGRPTAFRARNISRGSTPESLSAAIKAICDESSKNLEIRVKSLVPDCYRGQTQTAVLTFHPNPPAFLSDLDRTSEKEIEVDGYDVNFDKHFHNLTPLYPTTEGKITAE